MSVQSLSNTENCKIILIAPHRTLCGEKLHDLRRFLFFAHQGFIRQQQDENLANQSSCLTLVTNAVVAWNTVYLQAVIEQLKFEDVEINETDFVHLSPARFEHINPYGRYEFDVAKTFSRQELRPLRMGRINNT